MKEEMPDILIFSEFVFAPKILTVCARTMEVLVTELGDDYPLIRSTIPSHPIATYLPEEALSLFKARFALVESHNYEQVSELMPRKWLVGIHDGLKLIGLSTSAVEDLPELVATVESNGQKVSALPLPRGVVN